MLMIKRILLALGTLALLLAVGIYIYIQHLKPTYSGELVLEGLTDKVEVYFDDYGIPHIYGQSEEDAYLALGYVHAQDRLFQMEVVRRIASGRLSEIFGKDLVKADKLFRTLGIHKYSEMVAEDFASSVDPKIKKNTDAYLAGVNKFIDGGPTPIEFSILGIEKSHFTIVDIHNAIGYLGFSFASAYKIEPLLSHIYQNLGADYLKAFDLGSSDITQTIDNFPGGDAALDLSNYVSNVMDVLPTASWIGSNSWVLGPEKTQSGKVILENDPHVGFAQPAVWYEAHLEAPGFSVYGYYIAGVPFAPLSHSRDCAIGLTMFTNDDLDFYQEKITPNDSAQYEHGGQSHYFETRKETIKVKDSSDVAITVRETIHGPIINDVLDLKSEPVSMYWTFTQKEAPILETLYELNHITNINDARAVARKVHAPGLNIMYGDREGNIAWWASAHLIRRPDSTNSVLVNDGASGQYDALGFYAFEENPQAENPPWHYVYSANNQTRTTFGKPYPGHYAAEDRARRIVAVLDKTGNFTTEQAKQMALDTKSENAPEVVATILNAIRGTIEPSGLSDQAWQVLEKWDGSFSLESNAPIIYSKVLFKILEGALKDELGEKNFKQLFETHMIQRSTQPLLSNDSTVWWDDVHTPDKVETRADVFNRAWNESLKELEELHGDDLQDWKWGKVHTIEHEHPFGKVGVLKKLFNVGPYEVPGSNMVINNLKFHLYEPGQYHVYAGPSTRRIIDFSDVESNSWSILPTGNSGNPFSPHYADQAEMFAKGEYRKQMMNKDEIKNTSPNLLVFKPLGK